MPEFKICLAPWSSPVSGQTYFDTTLNHVYVYNGSGWEQASGASGSGSVTSVGLSLPSVFTVSGSPVTTSGTLTAVYASQGTGNQVFASPNGSSGVPTFRTLVAADIPTLTHTSISYFDTQVRTSRLDQMAAPTAAVSMNSQNITNVLDPTSAQMAATKNYVDNKVQGLTQLGTAVVLATANQALSALPTVDGVTLTAGQIILLTGQSTGSQNGLWAVASGSWTRPTVYPAAGVVPNDAYVFIQKGTVYADTGWVVTTDGTITVDTTSTTWVQFSAAGQIVADGTTTTKTGQVISINTSYVGQTSITTLGTVTTGTWTGTTIAIANGGTGATTAAVARTNLGATGKYSALIGDGSSTSIAVTQATHGLASNGQLAAQLYDASTGNQVFTDTSINNANGTVTWTFSSAPASNAYRIVILG